MRAIADVLLANPHVMAICDDVYEHIVYRGRAWTLAQVEPRLKERTLTVNSVSKVFSMTGWRLGYAGGPEWLIRAIDVLQSQSTTNPSSITQAAAAHALEGSLDFFAPRLESVRARRDRVLAALAETGGRLRASVPDGAFYVFANCEGMLGAETPGGEFLHYDLDAANYLLEAADAAMVPGMAFGLSPYLRIAYTVDDASLETACRKIVAACARLS